MNSFITLFCSFKYKINKCLLHIFTSKFENMLLNERFRTLGLGAMENKYNEYIGGIYTRKEELELARLIEKDVLKINLTVRNRSIMRMMVFIP